MKRILQPSALAFLAIAVYGALYAFLVRSSYNKKWVGPSHYNLAEYEIYPYYRAPYGLLEFSDRRLHIPLHEWIDGFFRPAFEIDRLWVRPRKWKGGFDWNDVGQREALPTQSDETSGTEHP